MGLQWQDAWIPFPTPIQPSGSAPLESQVSCVNNLFLPNSIDWNEEKVEGIFPELKSNILSIKPSRLGAPDRRIWLHTANCEYSAKSGYFIAREGDHHASRSNCPLFNWKEEIWNLLIAQKIKRRGDPETIDHLLFKCAFACEVWNLAPF